MSLLAQMQPQPVAPIQILVPQMLCFAFQKAGNESEEQKNFVKHQKDLNALGKKLEESATENEKLTEINKELQDKLYNASQDGREIYIQMQELHRNVTATKQILLDKKAELKEKINDPRIELLDQVLHLKSYRDHCKSVLEDVTKPKNSLLEDISVKEEDVKHSNQTTEKLNNQLKKKQAKIDALNTKIEGLKKDIESKMATAIAALNKKKGNQAPNSIKQPVKTARDHKSDDLKKGLAGKTNAEREGLLATAAATGNLAMVQALRDLGTSLSKQDQYGYHPLDRAVLSGNKEVTKLLLEAGASVRTQNRDGDTPLHLTARKGQLELAEMLINSGSDLNARNRKLNTPLHEAASYGNYDVCTILLRTGVEIDLPNSEANTPLHMAARAGQLEVVKLLEGQGANLSAINKEGRTPEQEAASAGQTEVAEWLGSQ